MSKQEFNAWYEILRVQIFLHKYFKKHKSAFVSDIATGLNIDYGRAKAITELLIREKFLSQTKVKSK